MNPSRRFAKGVPMSLTIDRRSLLQAGMFGIGALALPGNAAALLTARGFTHNVASGEPRQHSVLLWTRYVPPRGDSARLQWEVSASPSFSRIAASGEAVAEGAHDYTVKPVADGLAPGRWYYYRFRDSRGGISPVGRTRTLPDGPVERFKLAFFSCSNIGFGWFNAYAHAAARRDLDLMVHLGDYFYEYQSDGYPSLKEAVRPLKIVPTTELIHLADYRMRYASYRTDPDLQQLHRNFPMIAMWDDHESANDSWVGGAENHQPATEGPWSARKAAAVRAYREWLPVSDSGWEDYDVGDLATIFKIETRLTGRVHQFDLSGAMKNQPDLNAALIRFRDGPWQDPARTLMGAEQEHWLANAFRRSTGRGAKWQVLAQQTVMGTLVLPPEAASWPASSRSPVDLAAAKVGLPYDMDNWDGYPAARRRLLASAANANANLVVLSGDSHNAWAYDHQLDGAPVGIEFGGQSVSSPGFEQDVRTTAPAEQAHELVGRNPALQWADTSRRGYATVDLTPQAATGEWVFMDTIRQRTTRLSGTHRMSSAIGARRFTA
jgi:alkaline phosphatase D